MIELGEYARLLGYPAGKRLEGAVRARALQSMAWYRRHGRARAFYRRVDGVTVAAFTAGPEVASEIARRWRDDRVDEAYFLDRLAAAVVERMASAVPHRSPGHRGFALEEQAALMERLGPEAPVTLLPSGMLEPVHSLLAVVGESSTGCAECDWRCRYRRVS